MAMISSPILCVGTLLLDTLAVVDRLPGDDERVEAEHVVLAGGGNASTAAVAIARLGVDVEFAGVVGDDADGHRLVAELQDEGVGVRHVRFRQDIRTTHSVVIVNTSTSTRTIITKPATAPDSIPEGFEWVHVDKIGYRALLATPRLRSRVSIDDGNPVPDLDLTRIDLYVPTVDVLAGRYPGRDAIDAARAAREDGAGIVVATAGPRGSIVVDGDRAWHAPAHGVQPVSSLGAGDVFHGALLAGLALGKPVPDAARFANVTAALSCRSIDGRSGIPHRDEVETLLADLPPAVDASAGLASILGHHDR